LLDPPAADEADDVGGDFVDDADGEDGCVIAAAAGGFAHGGVGLGGDIFVVDEREIFWPGDVEENLQAVLIGQIAKPFRRVMVNAEAIGPQLAHLSKVAGGLLAIGEKLAGAIGGKGAVGDALDVEFLVAEPEKLAIAANAVGGRLDPPLPAAVADGRSRSGLQGSQSGVANNSRGRHTTLLNIGHATGGYFRFAGAFRPAVRDGDLITPDASNELKIAVLSRTDNPIQVRLANAAGNPDS
jgi:hypothetical protein